MKYAAAVSGGPDSMALLAWMEARHLDYGICHVNYHKRASACRDEQIVREWASKHHRELIVLHPRYAGGNFQGWARDVRYRFFETCAKVWNADTIVTGHQLDDSIETWMMQKKRSGIYEHAGLPEKTKRGSLTLFRPLLQYEKKELEAFCKNHGIEYGTDESNQSDQYERNRIRHQILEKADRQQKMLWKEQIEKDEQDLQARTRFLNLQASRPAGEWIDLPQAPAVLDVLICRHAKVHLGRRHLDDLIEKLRRKETVRAAGYCLQIDHGQLLFVDEDPPVPFYIHSADQLENLCRQSYRFQDFTLSFQGRKIQSFMAGEEDFPLLIRPWKAKDAIVLRFGTKKISRLLIDRKIPAACRHRCLVIEGKNGLFFASYAGCDPRHYIEKAPFHMLESIL